MELRLAQFMTLEDPISTSMTIAVRKRSMIVLGRLVGLELGKQMLRLAVVCLRRASILAMMGFARSVRFQDNTLDRESYW